VRVHFTYFSVKRPFLSVMHKVQIPMLRRVGLTPARFDVLYILHQQPSATYERMLQRELEIFQFYIHRFRDTLADSATLYYDWHPDD
jgi:hypothetical protein